MDAPVESVLAAEKTAAPDRPEPHDVLGEAGADVPVDPYGLGSGRLRQIVAYGRKVYDLKDQLDGIKDARRDPRTSAGLVAAAIFFCGLLRIRSFNALEPRLRELPFLHLVDALPSVAKLCSVDTLSRALRVMDHGTIFRFVENIVSKAERNKVFREGWHGALRYVAIDGWEPISSYYRHCSHCLVRHVKQKQRDGTIIEVEQYYHRYVVAMLIDSRFDLALAIEPLLPNALREPGSAKDGEDEGELTAAIRLLRRVKKTYPWVDVVVGDGLYSNGVFLSVTKELGMGAIVVARKEGDEPLKEALSLWRHQPPHEVVVDNDARERIELWDCPGLETLDTYDGPIRVVRGRVTDLDLEEKPASTWCVLVTGCATRLSPRKAIAAARGRWHIENTGFHQWTTRWRFDHVFVHDGQGLLALYGLFFAAYNLLTLFLYRQLRSYGRDRGKDVTRTISRLIDEMLDDLARLVRSPWNSS